MRKPLFSIIIPTLNEEKFLPKLLASLASQTNKNFEVIVVDGKSKDRTVSIAETYKRKLPKLAILLSTIHGISKQRNIGEAKARGNWLVFIDADSVLLPYAMERIDIFIKTHKPIMFTTWFRSDSELVGDALVTLLFNMLFEGAVLFRRPFTQGTFAALTRSEFTSVGGYDESLEFGEDYDLTKRVCQKGNRLSVLRETLYIYSLRRYRHQGTIPAMQAGVRAILSVLLTNKTPRAIAGYITGGHLYSKKRIKLSVLKTYERKLKALIKELFT